jgi:hypothetical protein
MIEEITKLTAEWYHLIGSDHHKDRDCHWYINTKWSYGRAPVYVVEHYGYILDHFDGQCDTYEEALRILKLKLEDAIAEEKQYQEQSKEEPF